MDRQILNFTANEQTLIVENPIRISTNKVNYIEAHFSLGANWSGYDSVRAVWFNDYQTISTVLDSQGVCRVPFEVMKRKGQVKVDLVGSISEGDVLTDRLTSYPVVAVIVDCVAPITGAETSPITPSQFEQYVAIVQALVGSVRDIDRIELNPDYTLTIYYSDGTSDTTSSIRGATGNGIASIAKTGSSGTNPVVDTYTVTYTGGNTFAFTVTNGKKGDTGATGATGPTGNGIQSIYKTGTSGLVDTYTILYTNGNTTTFEITNGQNGSLASTVLASTYSSSKTYAVGDYVYYSGNLYRCTTAITTAEAWTSGHWTQVALADDVSDLKSDFDDAIYNGFDSYSIVQGVRIATDIETVRTDSTRCTINRAIHAKAGDIIKITNNTSGQKYALASSSYDSGWQTSDFAYVANTDSVFLVNIAKSDVSAAIAPSEVGLQVICIDKNSLLQSNRSLAEKNLYGAVFNNGYDYTDGFVKGVRTTQNPSNVGTNDTIRCTTASLIKVNAGDEFVIRNNASGQRFVLATTDFDSGWQTGGYNYVAHRDGVYFINVGYSSETAQTPALDPSLITLSVSVKTKSSLIWNNYQQAENVKHYLLGEPITMPFELGLVTYGSTWVYTDGNTMVRTKQGELVHLLKGTTIGLTDYTDAKYYVGWFDNDGNPKMHVGWLTRDFVVEEDGDYSLLLANLTPRAQSNVSDLADLVRITPIDVLGYINNQASDKGASLVHPAFMSEKFIAHRGCDSSNAPENTIPAYKWAYDTGYRIFEYDVRFTLDNVPVLLHDETINRTARNADGTEISETIYVANTNYNDLLQYDFGIWRGEHFRGTKIPTVEELLTFIKKYNCCGDTDWTTLDNSITNTQIDIFVELLKEKGMTQSVNITSNMSVIGRLLSRHPNLIVNVSDAYNQSLLDDANNMIKNARLRTVSLQYPYATEAVHDYAHSLGFMTKTFTPYTNAQINESLAFAPDLMIVGTLGRNEIVLE